MQARKTEKIWFLEKREKDLLRVGGGEAVRHPLREAGAPTELKILRDMRQRVVRGLRGTGARQLPCFFKGFNY